MATMNKSNKVLDDSYELTAVFSKTGDRVYIGRFGSIDSAYMFGECLDELFVDIEVEKSNPLREHFIN